MCSDVFYAGTFAHYLLAIPKEASRVSDLLELELHLWATIWVLGSDPESSGEQPVPSTTKPALQLLYSLSK